MAFSLGGVNEMDQAMAAARNGALEGALTGSLAIYPDESFSNYERQHPQLLNPSSVKIVKIDHKDQGFNPTYNRTKIQLKIHAVAPSIKLEDRGYMGDRINFYTRKSICEAFKTQDLTNSLYNPAFSDRYVFTTGDVEWD